MYVSVSEECPAFSFRVKILSQVRVWYLRFWRHWLWRWMLSRIWRRVFVRALPTFRGFTEDVGNVFFREIFIRQNTFRHIPEDYFLRIQPQDSLLVEFPPVVSLIHSGQISGSYPNIIPLFHVLSNLLMFGVIYRMKRNSRRISP
jgi:hypothetical protein